MLIPHQMWTFLAACLVVYLMPGPDMAYIATNAMRGRRQALLAAAGTLSGVVTQAAAAALGITVIFQVSPIAFEVVRWLGVAYLAYLGYRTLTGGADDDGVADGSASRVNPWRIVLQGAAINILNPKVGLFFLAFLPQFVDPAVGRIPLQLASLGAIFAIGALVWVNFLALAFSHIGARLKRSARIRRWQKRILGTAFLGFAGALAVSVAIGNR